MIERTLTRLTMLTFLTLGMEILVLASTAWLWLATHRINVELTAFNSRLTAISERLSR